MKVDNLKRRIEEDIKLAMHKQQKNKVRALKSIQSFILLEERKRGEENKLSDKALTKLLLKVLKEKEEAIKVYEKQGQKDLIRIDLDEIEVIRHYLPKQLSEEELRETIDQIIKGIDAKGKQDRERVITLAKEEIGERATTKAILRIIREKLADFK
ncbi:MAG: GatB/YqeY domain-containing protein [Cytophagales bacterium]|nr:GatB/YqeY domain-containing protein [Cytophagales bacterium]